MRAFQAKRHTAAEELPPSWTCYGDAETLDWLWVNGKPTKQLSPSPLVAEREHSRTIFNDLLDKHENCYEALFGLGRLAVLEEQFEEGARYLREARKSQPNDALCLTWLAWAVLLQSAGKGLLGQGSMLMEANDLCHAALTLEPNSALAMQCLVHVYAVSPLSMGAGAHTALPYAARLAAVRPTAGLLALARLMLLGSQEQVAAGLKALRAFLAEAPITGEAAVQEVAVALIHRCLQHDVQVMQTTRSATMAKKDPPPFEPRLVAVKMLALDALWRHLMHQAKVPSEAVEVALLAAGAFRPCPLAWQRAVVLALKALATQGQWEECWRLAAAELGFKLSLEVLYQCGRLAYFDGRREAMEAYLPHLVAMLPQVPPVVQPDVRFWIGMLHHKLGNIFVAVPILEELLPALDQTPHRRSKAARVQKVLAYASKPQADTRHIYDFSNAVWRVAMGKSERVEAKAVVPPPVAEPAPAPRRPPGYVPLEEREDLSRQPPGYVPPEEREDLCPVAVESPPAREPEPPAVEDLPQGEVAQEHERKEEESDATVTSSDEEETIFVGGGADAGGKGKGEMAGTTEPLAKGKGKGKGTREQVEQGEGTAAAALAPPAKGKGKGVACGGGKAEEAEEAAGGGKPAVVESGGGSSPPAAVAGTEEKGPPPKPAAKRGSVLARVKFFEAKQKFEAGGPEEEEALFVAGCPAAAEEIVFQSGPPSQPIQGAAMSVPGPEEQQESEQGQVETQPPGPTLPPGAEPWLEILVEPLPPEIARPPRRPPTGLLEVRLRAAARATAWHLWDTWSASRALHSIEVADPFLASLCKGRLALLKGDVCEAEKIWTAASEQKPWRPEPSLELWRLHASKGSHRLAVLAAKKVDDLFRSPDAERAVTILTCEQLSGGKLWCGSFGESVHLRLHVPLLLAKSLRCCGLWEDAWRVLDSAGAEVSVALGQQSPVHYQMLKLAASALEDLLLRWAKDDSMGIPLEERDDRKSELLQCWLGRGQGALECLECIAARLTIGERLRCAFWRARFTRCVAAATSVVLAMRDRHSSAA